MEWIVLSKPYYTFLLYSCVVIWIVSFHEKTLDNLLFRNFSTWKIDSFQAIFIKRKDTFNVLFSFSRKSWHDEIILGTLSDYERQNTWKSHTRVVWSQSHELFLYGTICQNTWKSHSIQYFCTKLCSRQQILHFDNKLYGTITTKIRQKIFFFLELAQLWSSTAYNECLDFPCNIFRYHRNLKSLTKYPSWF